MSLVIHFDKENLQKQIENNEKIINDPSFWDNQKKALELVNEQNKIKEIFSSLINFENIVKELEDTLSLLKESYDDKIISIPYKDICIGKIEISEDGEEIETLNKPNGKTSEREETIGLKAGDVFK